jgi:hypothetical protein
VRHPSGTKKGTHGRWQAVTGYVPLYLIRRRWAKRCLLFRYYDKADYSACQSRFAEAVSRTVTVDGMHDDEALEGVRRIRSDILQARQIFLLAQEELTAARKLAQDVLRGPDPPQS